MLLDYHEEIYASSLHIYSNLSSENIINVHPFGDITFVLKY